MTAVVSIFGQPHNVRHQPEMQHFALATPTGVFEVHAPVEQALRVDLSRPVHLTGTLHIERDKAGGEISYIRLLAISNIQQQPAPADHFRLLLTTALRDTTPA
ncbi:MAG: hypothetical protein Kow0031_09130 [Anaerolineae bacterium]